MFVVVEVLVLVEVEVLVFVELFVFVATAVFVFVEVALLIFDNAELVFVCSAAVFVALLVDVDVLVFVVVSSVLPQPAPTNNNAPRTKTGAMNFVREIEFITDNLKISYCEVYQSQSRLSIENNQLLPHVHSLDKRSKKC